ncbi:RecA family protein [Magnetospirillum molischianum]|uniref:Protein RecA n=1 Tax=Magnetospirillum molischianum DSM 120 TaxID=1150626 RepID=H8FY99_MAGML|nr:RecA protein [Magnetospirillum molischianum]CCG43337.1 RecA protein [Magnetospirillum molischianum DSM 120]
MSKSPADVLAEALLKTVGGNDEVQEVRGWIDTGYPPLNYAISGSYNGGMPMGRIIEMFGPPSSGKTAIATNVMKNAQKAGGFAMFFDHERSFDKRLAEKMGLDTSPGRFLFKTPRTYEESTTIAIKAAKTIRDAKALPEDAPIVVVFDSLASMIPQSKADKDATDFNMNDNTALARATSANFNALALHAEEMNILIIFLNQARTKIGVMFGDPTTTPGGNAPEFYASVRIKLGRSMLTAGTGEDKTKIGQRIGAECVKNKVNRPFLKASWDFLFQPDGTGKFDVVGSLVDYLVAVGALEKGKAHITWTDGKSYFRKALVEKLEADPTGVEQLKALLPAVGRDLDEALLEAA